MVLGVIIGVTLLLLLIGLVVLQGMIEWGNLDVDAFFKPKQGAPAKEKKPAKPAKKSKKKPAKKGRGK
jgi:hypothetical protein